MIVGSVNFENWWNSYNANNKLDLIHKQVAYEAWKVQQHDIDKLKKDLQYYKDIVDRTSSKWHLID